MSTNYKKNFTDRLQFLGVVGPFVIILTLFCVLLRGSFKGWYLFFVTLAALPMSWKWQTKGFFASLGALAISYLSMYPFFESGDRLWQMGGCLSLALGLFITHLGFEEIKAMLLDLQIESQSRLDNLIELDDQLKRAKKDWDLSEEEYLAQKADKDQLIQKLSLEADSLEQASQLMDKELKHLQQLNLKYLDQIEKSSQQISKLEVEQLRASEMLQTAQHELALSITDREVSQQNQIEENEFLIQKLNMEIFELEEKFEAQTEQESSLSQQAREYAQEMQKLEELLRDKVSEIYELHHALAIKETETLNFQREIEKRQRALLDKEKDILHNKTQIDERDQTINEFSKKNRDLEQNLLMSQANIEEMKAKIRKLELLKSELDKSQEYMQSSLEQKTKMKNLELEELNNELKQKRAQMTRLMERNNELGQAITMYEERTLALEMQNQENEKLSYSKLTEFNDARFALHQANLDKERLKKELGEIQEKGKSNLEKKPSKHWLLQLESILKQNSFRKVDLQHLPKDLSQEIVTLNQTKALYKQLREQFEDKNKTLEEIRDKLFKAESQFEKLKKQCEQDQAKESELESELQKNLFIKDQEVKIAEDEVLSLNEIIGSLLSEIEKVKG